MEEDQFFGSSYKGSKYHAQPETRSTRAAGFGAIPDDNMDRGIDLNEQLIMNKPATFFMRVNGSSMIDAGVYDGDIVIVDKSIKPQNGKIVIAQLDGELLIRRYEQSMNKLKLVPETTKLSAIEIGEFSECRIWGVVTCVIRVVDRQSETL